jgi:hypothetical protein
MLPIVRLIIGVLAGLLFVGGLGGAISGLVPAPSALWTMAVGAVGVIVIALERMRYGSGSEAADGGSGMQPTDEVFVDPTTGQRTRVWIDPASGQRTYRPEG